MGKTRAAQKSGDLVQPNLPFPHSHGGRRPGAGRKRIKPSDRGYVPHTTRPAHRKCNPVHITVRQRPKLRSFRAKRTFAIIRDCFAKGCDRFGFRLIHFSVQSNHLHLICEADDRRAMSRGLQGLLSRIAKAVNRLWHRKGSVFRERYHEEVLESPSRIRNAIRYVLNNLWKHIGRHVPRLAFRGLDPMASGIWFDGWNYRPAYDAPDPPTARSQAWMLHTGWKQLGLIDKDSVPGPLR